jgi:6-pyruvoyltetrahydropterin/6-carboxytetrahydropterin synthase
MAQLQNRVEFHFAAAHRLPRYDGPCFRLHGHNYKLFVTVAGEPDPQSGMFLDFEVLRRIVNDQVLSRCDHRYLNDFIENPTAEHIAIWIWDQLKPALQGLCEVTLYETPEYCVIYNG